MIYPKGAYIIADLKLPPEYPAKPPGCYFRNDFKHVNCFDDKINKLDLLLIHPDYWGSNTKLIEIINAI
jgi:ubiquitin-protein ligase